MTVDDLQKRIAGGYAAGLGMRFTLATPELVCATMLVEARHSRSAGVMHGGAIMTFADTLGGAITMMNLPAGRTSTTVESKANFLRPGEVGTELEGECVRCTWGDEPSCVSPASPRRPEDGWWPSLPRRSSFLKRDDTLHREDWRTSSDNRDGFVGNQITLLNRS